MPTHKCCAAASTTRRKTPLTPPRLPAHKPGPAAARPTPAAAAAGRPPHRPPRSTRIAGLPPAPTHKRVLARAGVGRKKGVGKRGGGRHPRARRRVQQLGQQVSAIGGEGGRQRAPARKVAEGGVGWGGRGEGGRWVEWAGVWQADCGALASAPPAKCPAHTAHSATPNLYALPSSPAAGQELAQAGPRGQCVDARRNAAHVGRPVRQVGQLRPGRRVWPPQHRKNAEEWWVECLRVAGGWVRGPARVAGGAGVGGSGWRNKEVARPPVIHSAYSTPTPHTHPPPLTVAAGRPAPRRRVNALRHPGMQGAAAAAPPARTPLPRHPLPSYNAPPPAGARAHGTRW